MIYSRFTDANQKVFMAIEMMHLQVFKPNFWSKQSEQLETYDWFMAKQC